MPISILSSVKELRCGRVTEVSISLVQLLDGYRFLASLDTDVRIGQESERFAWIWDATSEASRDEVLRTLGWMAAAQQMAFCDADHVAEHIQCAGRTIDVDEYARYRG